MDLTGQLHNLSEPLAERLGNKREGTKRPQKRLAPQRFFLPENALAAVPNGPLNAECAAQASESAMMTEMFPALVSSEGER